MSSTLGLMFPDQVVRAPAHSTVLLLLLLLLLHVLLACMGLTCSSKNVHWSGLISY